MINLHTLCADLEFFCSLYFKEVYSEVGPYIFGCLPSFNELDIKDHCTSSSPANLVLCSSSSFHPGCVKLTTAQAEQLSNYLCDECSSQEDGKASR